ncbi:MAG: CTP synthase [Candidatus Doudnabacteria bacterium]|nr:CTP synthase [Candidatus Doudnabacteria bacterium]
MVKISNTKLDKKSAKSLKTKFIFISGGVISGIGKGITSASIGAILKSKGYKVSAVKVDMYLNQDAGTIRPQEHGEVFVTVDGIETDQDLGHYERFIGEPIYKHNYVTTGQIYAEVLRKERAFEYEGEDVEAIPHVTDEIIRRWEVAGKNYDFCLVELGGTVGEYQNGIFFEATRIMKLRDPYSVLHIHVAYLPIPSYLGEMKSKPVQQSVRVLNSMGIEPDIIVGRSSVPIDERRKERVALFCNVDKTCVLSNPDVSSIYEVPVILEQQKAGEIILEKFGIKPKKQDLKEWKKLVQTIKTIKKEVKIAVVGKYFGVGKFQLSDSYVSVIESIKHAAWANKVRPVLTFIDSVEVEKKGAKDVLQGFHGIVVPGGFGKRGTEGMIKTIEYARVNKVPYLGLCYGMQMATIEFARNVAGLKGSNTTEVDEDSAHPVIHIMPDQEKKLLNREYGATMRLGAWDCVLARKTKAEQCYVAGGVIKASGKALISERHRHRYEFNNAYLEQLTSAGLIVSGTSPDGNLVEIIEVKDHPFFVGSQFHPEFQSRPLLPHPLFSGFMKAVVKK